MATSMQEFDSKFTIEFNGSKGWEVDFKTDSLNEAINEFRDCVLSPENFGVQYRLTSPKRED